MPVVTNISSPSAWTRLRRNRRCGILLAAILSAGLYGGTVYAASCAYRENCDCSSPGDPELWECAYCMEKVHSQEETSHPVEACLGQLYPEWRRLLDAPACARNRHWHRKLCALRGPKDSPAWRACMDEVPDLVRQDKENPVDQLLSK